MSSKLLVAAFAITLAACGGNKGGPDGGSGGGTGGSVGGGTGGSGGSNGGGSAGGGTGGSGGGAATMGTNCTNAIPLTLGTEATNDVLTTANQKIHFKVSVMANDFIELSTSGNPDSDPALTDSAIAIYDAQGGLVATIDDSYPRFGTDTDMFYRVPTTQDLCVVLMDWDTWTNSGDQAGHSDHTKLLVAKLNDTANINNHDTEQNNDAAMAQTAKVAPIPMSASALSSVYGLLDGASDVDVYKFTIPSGASALSMEFAPTGAPVTLGENSYGSTLARFSVKVTDLAGTTVLGKRNFPSNPDDASDSTTVPTTGSMQYLLWVERPAGLTPGSNDFYYLSLFFFTDSPAEQEDGGNDLQIGALPITQTVSTTNAKLRSGFVLGNVSPTGDTDFYSFTANQNDVVALACGAWRDGSGLTGATFAIYNPTTLLQSETEGQNADVQWLTPDAGSKGALIAGDAGTYFLKVNATGQDSANAGTYYRCGVHVEAP